MHYNFIYPRYKNSSTVTLLGSVWGIFLGEVQYLDGDQIFCNSKVLSVFFFDSMSIGWTMEEKMKSFQPKKLSHWRTKIQPWIPSNWRIFESNWLDIESQFDWNILQLLGIPGWILVPPVTQLFGSKWFNFFSQWSE